MLWASPLNIGDVVGSGYLPQFQYCVSSEMLFKRRPWKAFLQVGSPYTHIHPLVRPHMPRHSICASGESWP